MTTRLHVASSIFFPNPYVVRIDHTMDSGNALTFSRFVARVKKVIQGTWGFSLAEYELIYTGDTELSWALPDSKLRSYWCFADEADALQFRLMVDNTVRVFMWPSNRKFTIHEFITDIPG